MDTAGIVLLLFVLCYSAVALWLIGLDELSDHG